MRHITRLAARTAAWVALAGGGAVSALAVAGCSPGAATAGIDPELPAPAAAAAQAALRDIPEPTPVATAPTTPTSSPTMLPTTPAPPPTTVPLDAVVALATALDALNTGYHFTTTATVAGRPAVIAEGDHIAGSTRMTITSGGTGTEYVVTAEAAWALADGAWQQLDGTQGLSDPVGQLRDPLEVAIVGTAEAATITARYPAARLGLASDATVEFQLADGRITSLRLSSTTVTTHPDGTTSEQPADVTAVITPIAPGTEITLPVGET
ncbi:MAG TPA: hypothetical protein VNQ73_05175 [Ilumatobacter sp.]|nr:hypothetical protein [Ilumatobacter sp.]